MNRFTITDRCDIDAYRAWTDRRAAPAYLRGMPTWVWQTAVNRRRDRAGRHRVT